MAGKRRIPFLAFDLALADIAGAALVVMMLITVGSSFTRFLFSAPFPDVEAIAEMLLVVVVFLPLAYTQALREHVEVTLFTDRLSEGTKRWLVWFGCLVGLLAFGVLLYALAQGAHRAFATGDAYLGVNKIETWPARTVAAVGTAALIIRLALDLTIGRRRAGEPVDEPAGNVENTI